MNMISSRKGRNARKSLIKQHPQSLVYTATAPHKARVKEEEKRKEKSAALRMEIKQRLKLVCLME